MTQHFEIPREENPNISLTVEIHDEEESKEKKCKTGAAAVVKGKIYFYCLKENWKERAFCTGSGASRIYALWLNM